MIEYTYFEIFLLCAFFIALGYALKYREESHTAKRFVKMLIEDEQIYKRVHSEYTTFTKELRNAD